MNTPTDEAIRIMEAMNPMLKSIAENGNNRQEKHEKELEARDAHITTLQREVCELRKMLKYLEESLAKDL